MYVNGLQALDRVIRGIYIAPSPYTHIHSLIYAMLFI